MMYWNTIAASILYLAVPSWSLKPPEDFCVTLNSVNVNRRRLQNAVTCSDGNVIDLTNIAGQFPNPLETTRLRLQKSSGYCTNLSSLGGSTPNKHRMESALVTCFSVFAAISLGQTVEVCIGLCQAQTRRHLEANAIALDEDGEEYHKFVEKCSNFEYQGNLVVDDHIMVVGVPGERAQAAGCPHVAAHSAYDSVDSSYRKEVFVWDDISVAEHVLEDSFHVGNFKFSELVHAHERVDPTRGGVSVGYDIITNNCGNYVLDLASELGVKIDAKTVKFVARRLFEKSGQDLVDKIRNSINFLSLFPAGRTRGRVLTSAQELDGEEVVRALVENSISEADIY